MPAGACHSFAVISYSSLNLTPMPKYSKTILCVDDDADDLGMLRHVLQEIGSGYTIVEAFDGVHALEQLKQMEQQDRLPCLIILDINMPRMDGKQTVVKLQKDRVLSAVPVVLFSTSSSLLDQTFSKLKNVELITKPFDFKTLYSTASKLLQYCLA